MKHFYFVIIGFMIFLSCNSDKNEEKNSTDNEIIEVDANNKPQKNKNEEKSVSKDQQVNIDSKFRQFLEKFKKEGLPYTIEPEEQMNYGKIPLDYQADYLSKAEDLTKSELKEMEPYAKFFYISNPVSTNKFNGIVYGRSEMGSSYYIFCTFNNNGKIISNIEIAMYQLIGAGPQAGQEYFMKGEIDKDLTITVKSDEETKIYYIKENGKIVKK
jgi:hypothetical protein